MTEKIEPLRRVTRQTYCKSPVAKPGFFHDPCTIFAGLFSRQNIGARRLLRSLIALIGSLGPRRPGADCGIVLAFSLLGLLHDFFHSRILNFSS